MKKFAPLFIFLIMLSCSIEEPVNENFYLNDSGEIDLDTVAGRNKPFPPIATDITCCENQLTVTFVDSNNGDGTGYDIDGDELIYLIYYSMTDPGDFGDERDYYDPLRYIGYTTETGSVNLYTSGSGTVYLWLTAYDGWRESDHSPVLSTDFPGPACD